jgi:NADH-ubiquinone oxidoreductase chain 1
MITLGCKPIKAHQLKTGRHRGLGSLFEMQITIITLFTFLALLVCILVNVAFITLLERKILGYAQLRKGPNKVRFVGILQPFNDAIKLFSKEYIGPSAANHVPFFFAPVVAISLSLLVFSVFPLEERQVSSRLSILFVFMVLRMNVYPTLLSGWRSNSKYGIVGALRAVAQTISYEVRLALIFLFFLLPGATLSWSKVSHESLFWVNYILFPPVAGLWLITRFAETNRTPFDFAEGESELVSGFNVEYGAVGFALIFMAEYTRIFFMSSLFVLFFRGLGTSRALTYGLITGLVFIWVWVRATLPRYRFDLLINMAWKSFLPITLFTFPFRARLLI